MVTVSELIKKLQHCPQDAVVIMSKDGEGNSYSPLATVEGENIVYIPETSWDGEIGFTHLTPELERQGFTDEDVIGENRNGDIAVVFWPVN